MNVIPPPLSPPPPPSCWAESSAYSLQACLLVLFSVTSWSSPHTQIATLKINATLE